MTQNPIKYSDLISPDDSIEKLIEQLGQLNDTYTGLGNNIKQQAQGIANGLKAVSGATEKGRKTTKEASEEAQRLEKAYKQLDAALAENSRQIALLNVVKREANNYNKQMVLRGKEEISTMQQIKEASYQQLSAQYSLNKAYINTLSGTERQIQRNKELIQTTKEIYEQMKRLQADTGKMQLNVGNYPQLSGLTSAIAGLSPMFSQLNGGLGKMAMAFGGVAAAGAGLASVVSSNVSLAKDYEKSLSVLAAILGTTKDGVTALSEQAQDLGATTVFTAKEVVQLQTELAKLGYTTDQIMNMAPSVLNFAQSTGSSLADAASLAGAALRMFEKDTTHTEEFVDKMSAATTKSALSFNYLNSAMSTIAPVANAFGFNIEEVLALLGQLANAGFDASSAATATRNIILNLADANGKLAKALGEPVTNLDGLINGLKSLTERGIDLGEALELTDKRSVAAFNTFLKGADDVLKLRDELADCDGYAQQMADTMGNNLEGSLKSLSSAWEGLNLHINQSNGLLKTFIDFMTKAIRKLDEWIFAEKGANAVFNQMADDYEKAQEKMNEADRKREESNKKLRKYAYENNVTYNGRYITKQEYDAEFGAENAKGGGSSKVSAKEKKAAEKAAKAAERERKQALKEQERIQKQSLELRRKYEDALIETYDDEATRERAKIVSQYDRKIEDLRIMLDKEKTLTVDDRKNINNTIIALEEAKGVKLAELVEKSAKKEKDALEKANREKDRLQKEGIRNSEKAIDLQYKTDLAEIESIKASEQNKTRMRLEAEKKRLQALLELYRKDGKILGAEEIKLIEQQIKNIDAQLTKNKPRDMYDLLGFNLTDEQKEGIDTALSYAMDSLNEFMDSWVQAAEKKKQLADEEVERTKSNLDKEIEARNNGYAANVSLARKELEEAKKNQQKALQEQQRAQKAQQALQTVQQATNLITATALIWSQLGFPWAIPAIAIMWGSFAAAKIKAAEVTSSTEEYGEGTVELLQGGSHQSGNDIDLGRKSNGTRRRAEGGEFFAVINKRNSRRYRSLIPDVVNSLNNGTFSEKYQRAYDDGGMAVTVQGQPTDIRELSNDVRLIREQGEKEITYDANGNKVMRYKNLRRIIKG